MATAGDDLRDQLIAAALAALEQAAMLGSNTARHAARIVQGDRRAGRPRIDDGAALDEVERLTRAGRGREAIGIVAARMASDPAEIEAIARRLRRKSNGRNSYVRFP